MEDNPDNWYYNYPCMEGMHHRPNTEGLCLNCEGCAALRVSRSYINVEGDDEKDQRNDEVNETTQEASSPE